MSNDDLLFRDYGKPPDPLKPRWTRRYLLLLASIVVVLVVAVGVGDEDFEGHVGFLLYRVTNRLGSLPSILVSEWRDRAANGF